MEKKYSEVGVQINLYCKNGIDSVGMTEQEKAMAHPYVKTIKICYGKNVNSDLCVKDPINHLDEIFLREPRFKSFARGIKRIIYRNRNRKKKYETKCRCNKKHLEDLQRLS